MTTNKGERLSAGTESPLAIMARVKSIGVHAKHDAKNTYVVSLTFEGDEQPTIKQFEALKAAALSGGVAQARQVPAEEIAKLGVAEVADAWAVLESHGFPPEAVGWPQENIGGKLPGAIDSAITALVNTREDLLAEVIKLRPQCSAGRDDPSADPAWNDGCDFAMTQLCIFLSVNQNDVRWDAATETVDGDVQAVIGNILRAKFGEDWGPNDPPQSPLDLDLIEQCAKIAEPWSGFMTGDKMGAMDRTVVEVRQEIAAAIRALAAQPQAAPVELDALVEKITPENRHEEVGLECSSDSCTGLCKDGSGEGCNCGPGVSPSSDATGDALDAATSKGPFILLECLEARQCKRMVCICDGDPTRPGEP